MKTIFKIIKFFVWDLPYFIFSIPMAIVFLFTIIPKMKDVWENVQLGFYGKNVFDFLNSDLIKDTTAIVDKNMPPRIVSILVNLAVWMFIFDVYFKNYF